MIYSEETVEFDPANGPVIVEVNSGYVTLGKFKLGYVSGGAATEYGSGDLSDAIPDIFIVPLAGESLDGLYSFIIGNYSPGDVTAHTEILVTYAVKQKDELLKMVTIQEQAQGIISAYHLIIFRSKP